jgi:ribonuclease D
MGRGSGDKQSAAVARRNSIDNFKQLYLNYEVINNQGEFDALVSDILSALPERLAVDFETASRNGQWGPENGRIRLIQIGVDDPKLGRKQWVIDCDKLEPSGINQIFGHDKIEKLIHFSKFEQGFAIVHLGQPISPVFDTCFAAQSINKSLRNLAETEGIEKARAVISDWNTDARATLAAAGELYLGVEIPKEEQASDWGEDALTKEQLDYAALDAAILLPLAEKTRAVADQIGATRKISYRVRRTQEEVMEEFAPEKINRMDESVDFAWELVDASSPEEVQTLWEGARTRTLAAHNREFLYEASRQRWSELNNQAKNLPN